MLEDLRFSDVITFLDVQRCGSLTAAARALRVTVSQVSKAVHRLEDELGTALLVRSARGVALTEPGRALLPQLEELAQRLRQVRPSAGAGRTLTMAAPSYLHATFLPRLARALEPTRLSGIELPPPLVRAYMAEHRFEVALLVGASDLPPRWAATTVGRVRKALLATPAVRRALGRAPVEPGRLEGRAFVMPTSQHEGRSMLADDGCPLTVRRAGHQAQTLLIGLELAAATDHLIFGPVLAARRFLDAGQLVEVPVRGWDLADSLLVACDGDRVLASEQRAIVACVSAALAELDVAAVG